ncbi:MAG TPA: SCP2 sterol-binding domain-containing protein [Acidimicrobiia bacterium]|nr:SCP2 sterol-binding domain-containing protein [Acidimicrobiia bacterium]
MPEFLSRDWIEALDAAARSTTLPADAATVSIEIEQVVFDAPGPEIRYHVRIEEGRVRVHPGPAASPHLRLIADYDVAARIQRGEVNAQQALAAGRLKVQGQFAHLVRAGEQLRSLDDVFAAVRRTTTFRDAPPSR